MFTNCRQCKVLTLGTIHPESKETLGRWTVYPMCHWCFFGARAPEDRTPVSPLVWIRVFWIQILLALGLATALVIRITSSV